MKLTKWSPLVDVGVESPVISIWVSFPNLRPHLFSPRILFGLGSIIGRPLKVDNASSVSSRSFVAHVLVKLDITKSYPDKVWLGPENLGYIQHVLMEAFPTFCASCKCIGHLSGDCQSHQSSTPPIVVPVVSKPLTVSVSRDGIGGDGNVAGIDTIVSNNVNEAFIIGSELPNASKLTSADVEAHQPVSEMGCVAPELGDRPMALAASLDGLDPPLPVLDGVLIPVGCSNLNFSISVGDEVEPATFLVLLVIRMRRCCDVSVSLGFKGVEGSDGQGIVVSSELQDSSIASMVPLVDVPISIISKAGMLAHQAKNNVLSQCDWLEDDISLEEGEVFKELDLDAQDNFDLSLLQVVDDGFFKNNVKCSKHNSKKK
ncbi:hypothetical protein M5K25_001961 [Dendrobium thyrsiflorum]|uniref:DUF4283 domain-containing protein n=1 Tax=Dendrobium thyrsiflorum TaxID=117978 RepID=A0ABD0VRS9_DENTH